MVTSSRKIYSFDSSCNHHRSECKIGFNGKIYVKQETITTKCDYCGWSKIVGFLKIRKDHGPSWNYFLLELCLDLSCAYKLLLPFRIHLNFVHNSFRLHYAHYFEHEVIILLI